MPDRTPEQIAADNQLDDAIAAAVTAYGLVESSEVVTTWVVAGASQGQSADRTGHFHLYPGGVQPTYVAVGLLRMTERQLLSTVDDEDE